MRLKLTLGKGSRTGRDVLATADVTATVGDVARRLSADPTTSAAPAVSEPTLRVSLPERRQGRLSNSQSPLHEAGLRSGDAVEVVTRTDRRVGDDLFGSGAATARVIAEPDIGREFTLTVGVNSVGRDPGQQVSLTDPEISRRHASITVAETVTILDQNSAYGLIVDGVRCHRSLVTASSRIQLGDTILSITPRLVADPAEASVGRGAFSRSPRVEPAYREALDAQQGIRRRAGHGRQWHGSA